MYAFIHSCIYPHDILNMAVVFITATLIGHVLVALGRSRYACLGKFLIWWYGVF